MADCNCRFSSLFILSYMTSFSRAICSPPKTTQMMFPIVFIVFLLNCTYLLDVFHRLKVALDRKVF